MMDYRGFNNKKTHKASMRRSTNISSHHFASFHSNGNNSHSGVNVDVDVNVEYSNTQKNQTRGDSLDWDVTTGKDFDALVFHTSADTGHGNGNGNGNTPPSLTSSSQSQSSRSQSTQPHVNNTHSHPISHSQSHSQSYHSQSQSLSHSHALDPALGISATDALNLKISRLPHVQTDEFFGNGNGNGNNLFNDGSANAITPTSPSRRGHGGGRGQSHETYVNSQQAIDIRRMNGGVSSQHFGLRVNTHLNPTNEEDDTGTHGHGHGRGYGVTGKGTKMKATNPSPTDFFEFDQAFMTKDASSLVDPDANVNVNMNTNTNANVNARTRHLYPHQPSPSPAQVSLSPPSPKQRRDLSNKKGRLPFEDSMYTSMYGHVAAEAGANTNINTNTSLSPSHSRPMPLSPQRQRQTMNHHQQQQQQQQQPSSPKQRREVNNDLKKKTRLPFEDSMFTSMHEENMPEGNLTSPLSPPGHGPMAVSLSPRSKSKSKSLSKAESPQRQRQVHQHHQYQYQQQLQPPPPPPPAAAPTSPPSPFDVHSNPFTSHSPKSNYSKSASSKTKTRSPLKSKSRSGYSPSSSSSSSHSSTLFSHLEPPNFYVSSPIHLGGGVGIGDGDGLDDSTVGTQWSKRHLLRDNAHDSSSSSISDDKGIMKKGKVNSPSSMISKIISPGRRKKIKSTTTSRIHNKKERNKEHIMKKQSPNDEWNSRRRGKEKERQQKVVEQEQLRQLEPQMLIPPQGHPLQLQTQRPRIAERRSDKYNLQAILAKRDKGQIADERGTRASGSIHMGTIMNTGMVASTGNNLQSMQQQLQQQKMPSSPERRYRISHESMEQHDAGSECFKVDSMSISTIDSANIHDDEYNPPMATKPQVEKKPNLLPPSMSSGTRTVHVNQTRAQSRKVEKHQEVEEKEDIIKGKMMKEERVYPPQHQSRLSALILPPSSRDRNNHSMSSKPPMKSTTEKSRELKQARLKKAAMSIVKHSGMELERERERVQEREQEWEHESELQRRNRKTDKVKGLNLLDISVGSEMEYAKQVGNSLNTHGYKNASAEKATDRRYSSHDEMSPLTTNIQARKSVASKTNLSQLVSNLSPEVQDSKHSRGHQQISSKSEKEGINQTDNNLNVSTVTPTKPTKLFDLDNSWQPSPIQPGGSFAIFDESQDYVQVAAMATAAAMPTRGREPDGGAVTPIRSGAVINHSTKRSNDVSNNKEPDFMEVVAAIVIQTFFRRHLAYRLTCRRYRAVLIIQRFLHDRLKRKGENVRAVEGTAYKMYDMAAVQIQAAWRGWWVRDCMNVENYCATIIQKTFRSYLERGNFKYDLYSVTMAQAQVRGYLARSKINREKKAAVMIQCQWRVFQAKYKIYQNLAHILIVQSVCRRFLAKKRVKHIRAKFRTTRMKPKPEFSPPMRSIAVTHSEKTLKSGTGSHHLSSLRDPNDFARKSSAELASSMNTEDLISMWKSRRGKNPKHRSKKESRKEISEF